MNATTILSVIIAIVLADFLLERGLIFLNCRNITTQLPEEVKGIYSEEKYQQSQQYKRATCRLELVTASLQVVILLPLREILKKVFGLIQRFKSKDELLEEEFSKFVADRVPEPPSSIPAIKSYFKAYVTSNRVRDIIDSRQYTDLATNPFFYTHDFRAVPQEYRTLVPEYIKDYASLNQFAT